MFSQRERLPRAHFETVLKTGTRFSSQNFTLVFSKKTTGYAVLIAKKTIGLAVKRHRIKRQVLEVLRAHKPSCAVIVLPRATVYGVSYEDILSELGSLLTKIHK